MPYDHTETRKATNALIDAAESGSITWESLARGCLIVMSEADARSLAEDDFDMSFDEDDDDDAEEDDDDDDAEDEPMLLITYQHKDCEVDPETQWTDKWTSAVNADCPHCGTKEIEPLEWEEIE